MNSVKDDPCGPGFPIRKSADQRVLAPPRSFSQRATSFIACVRQGILQTPLHKRLIAQQSFHAQKQDQRQRTATGPLLEMALHAIRLSVFRSTGCANRLTLPSQCQKNLRLPDNPTIEACIFRLTAAFRKNWWSRSGSNRRPEACKATALPTELRPRITALTAATSANSVGGPGTS